MTGHLNEWNKFKKSIRKLNGGTNFEAELSNLAVLGATIWPLVGDSKLVSEICRRYNEVADCAILFKVKDLYMMYGVGGEIRLAQGAGGHGVNGNGARILAEGSVLQSRMDYRPNRLPMKISTDKAITIFLSYSRTKWLSLCYPVSRVSCKT